MNKNKVTIEEVGKAFVKLQKMEPPRKQVDKAWKITKNILRKRYVFVYNEETNS